MVKLSIPETLTTLVQPNEPTMARLKPFGTEDVPSDLNITAFRKVSEEEHNVDSELISILAQGFQPFATDPLEQTRQDVTDNYVKDEAYEVVTQMIQKELETGHLRMVGTKPRVISAIGAVAKG